MTLDTMFSGDGSDDNDNDWRSTSDGEEKDKPLDTTLLISAVFDCLDKGKPCYAMHGPHAHFFRPEDDPQCIHDVFEKMNLRMTDEDIVKIVEEVPIYAKVTHGTKTILDYHTTLHLEDFLATHPIESFNSVDELLSLTKDEFADANNEMLLSFVIRTITDKHSDKVWEIFILPFINNEQRLYPRAAAEGVAKQYERLDYYLAKKELRDSIQSILTSNRDGRRKGPLGILAYGED